MLMIVGRSSNRVRIRPKTVQAISNSRLSSYTNSFSFLAMLEISYRYLRGGYFFLAYTRWSLVYLPFQICINFPSALGLQFRPYIEFTLQCCVCGFYGKLKCFDLLNLYGISDLIWEFYPFPRETLCWHILVGYAQDMLSWGI